MRIGFSWSTFHLKRGRLKIPSYSVRCMGLISRNWERKRFYKKVSVFKSDDGWYGIHLDRRSLRTPLRQMFKVPSEPLALAVAQEWNAQENFVQPSLMHITALCNTVLDDPHNASRESNVESLVHYLTSDTLCFRATEPEDLVSMQSEEWDPLINWFNRKFGVELSYTTSILPPVTPPLQTLSKLHQYLHQMDSWSFAGLTYCTESCKSLVLSCALFEDQVEPHTACNLSRLEVRYQISKWGSVEWQHNVEEADLQARLAASLLLKQFASSASS